MVDRKHFIVGLGELLWDIYPDQRRPGGAPANVAAHTARLGGRSAVVTGVGGDEDGAALRTVVSQWGVLTSGIQTVLRYPTGTVGITLDNDGIPAFRCSSNTAFDHLHWNKTAARLAGQANAVVIGTLAQRHLESRYFIQHFLDTAANALVVFDVNFRSWNDRVQEAVESTIERCDILKVNEEELRLLRKLWPSESPDSAYLMALVGELGLMGAALTLGHKGCMVTDGEVLVKEPGIGVEVVDTTGCGDAFTAVLTMGMLQGWPLDAVARCANGLAAFTATQTGAVPDYNSEQLVAFMNQHRIDWYF